MFRALWLANMVSAIGTMIQGVGAAWLMTTLASTPDLVALVQTATQAPVLLFALLAGTVADLWDRRWVLLLAHPGPSGLRCFSIRPIAFASALLIASTPDASR